LESHQTSESKEDPPASKTSDHFPAATAESDDVVQVKPGIGFSPRFFADDKFREGRERMNALAQF